MFWSSNFEPQKTVVLPPQTQEEMLRGWLELVKDSGRSNKNVTVPYSILELPCGCKRYAIEGARPGSTGQIPVDREFRLKQVGKGSQWLHLECGTAIATS